MAKALEAGQIYCSLDLELTGFDPTKDEILEVGFVLFSMTAQGAIIHKEWQQVFNPVREVHPKIFGLTGIRQSDLDDAPRFSEFRDELQKELGDAILVGHSISVDVRFLEAFGLRLSGRYIDTLDLVQFILPTHHSYNLENLMHTFRVPHLEAHRACADARATIVVLEKLLGTFANFPLELQQQAQVWADRGQFIWAHLLRIGLQSLVVAVEEEAKFSEHHVSSKPLASNKIVQFPFGTPPEAMLFGQTGTLIAVPNNQQMLAWWKQGLVVGAVGPEDSFSEKKFNELLGQSELSPDQIKFILKVLVWQFTNWQTQTILDLNLSFFGGQYRPLISGGAPFISEAAPIICCSHQTLLRLKSKALTERTLIIYDLGQFERSVMIGMGDRASWSHIVYVLKSMYNPETDTGARDLRNVVMQALADTDLFFGLVSMDVQKRFPRNSYIAEDALAADPYHYQRMVSAAEHYASQLNQHNRGLHNPAVTRFAVALRSFFTPKEGHVKWIESGDNRCMFFNLPLDIAPLVRDAVKQYADKIFVDDCGSREVTAYLQQRLGLDDYGMITARGAANPMEHKVICTISSTHPDDAVVVGLLAQPNLPALVLYENPADIKEFYKKHYGTLKAYAAVFAQDYSGGGNKMFRNFSINPLSIMLASPEYLQKTLSTKLPVKSLIWADFALEHSSQHPYELAVVNSFQQLDINVPMIWGFQLLWAILKACHTQSLERIIFYVSEMDDYQQGQLVDSLRQTPFLDLVLV